MLYLFSGDDTKNKLLAYEKLINSLPRGTEKFFIGRNNFDPLQVENLYSGAGLFFAEAAVVFSGILEAESPRDFLLKKLSRMNESGSYFIFLEGKLNKPVLDAFKKAKAKCQVFELPKEKKGKKEKFNSFLLANAFERKDKLSLWMYYRLAVDKGVGLEELAGVLFWKIKDTLLKKNFSKFPETRLKNFSSKLSYLLPEARKRGEDAEIAFEQFLLEIF
jgi:hypothetical protein